MNKYSRIHGLLATALAALALPAAAQFSETFVDDDFTSPTAPSFSSIQEAIDNTDANGTVHVAAGLYSESPSAGVPLIVIPAAKSGLRLLGAQADVDPRPSFGSPRTSLVAAVESIVEGNGASSPDFSLLSIEASGVEVNGFVFRNEDLDLVESPLAGGLSDVVVRFCIFSGSGDEGLQLRDIANALVEYNWMTETGGDGLSVCCGSSKAVIQFNELSQINTTNAAIYLYEPPVGGDGLEARIYRNLIRDVSTNDGIYIGIRDGSEVGLGGTGGEIVENTIRNVHHDGIQVFADGVTIQGNDLSMMASGALSPYGAIAIRHGVDNLQILNNAIHDNAFANADSAGIYIPAAVSWSNVAVHLNDFERNTPRAINNLSGLVLDARQNWWNAIDGPDDDAGVINGSGEVISIDVDASDYLTSPSGAAFDETFVDDDFVSPVPPNYTSIQAAINNTAAGGTVNVAPGSYMESPMDGVPLIVVPADKPGLRLRGAQADVDPRPSFGSPRNLLNGTVESIVEGNGGTAPNYSLLSIEASDVEVNGFVFRNEGPDLVESPLAGGLSNVAVRYSIFRTTNDEGLQLRDTADALVEFNWFNNTGGDGLSVCCGSTRAVIRYNELSGINTTNAAIYLYDPPVGGDGLQALIFRNLIRDVSANDGIYLGIRDGSVAGTGGTGGWIIENTFTNIHHDGIQAFTDGVLIQGNDFHGMSPAALGDYGAVVVRNPVDDIAIVNNSFHDNAYNGLGSAAIYLASGVAWTNVYATQNSFVGNTPRAINNLSGVVLPALGNWWGAADGPDDDAMAINGGGDAISIDVDASDYLTAAIPVEQALAAIPEDPVNFGTLDPDATLDLTLSVENTATTATLVIVRRGLTIGGADAGHFTVVDGPAGPVELAPGASIAALFTVRYSAGPDGGVLHTAVGTLESTDGRPATVTFNGAVTPLSAHFHTY